MAERSEASCANVSRGLRPLALKTPAGACNPVCSITFLHNSDKRNMRKVWTIKKAPQATFGFVGINEKSEGPMFSQYRLDGHKGNEIHCTAECNLCPPALFVKGKASAQVRP